MRVVVAAWVGSTNLGDELLHAGLRRLLAAHDATVAAISIAPAATVAAHGGIGLDHRDLHRIRRAVRSADAVIFGGGGLLQDVTSPFNLPYHLSRVILARRAGTPVVAVGLGVGPLETRLGQALTRAALEGLAGCTVRDQASATRLVDVLGDRVELEVAADLAFALDATSTEPIRHDDGTRRLVVSLRPWSTHRARLPAAARTDTTPEPIVQALATALDAAVDASGWGLRFVALQRDRDDAFHRRVAARMRAPASFATPHLDDLLGEFAAADAVVSMRYHGGVAATLAGRPSVLIGYDPKVEALAEELGAGGRLLTFDAESVQSLPQALAAVEGQGAAVDAACDRLRGRQAPTVELLGRVLTG